MVRFSWCSSFLGFLALAGLARADVTLPPIFADHAVLQRSEKTPVWGKAAPGEKVTVSLADTRTETTAGANGRWQAILNLKDKGPGPFELRVEGKNTLTIKDVLVGDVWICCGQSNMQCPVFGTLSYKEELAQSANPFLRQFTVAHVGSAKPRDEVGGRWAVAGPATTTGFTAVGYYFGKMLQKELSVPVALINASWDSSTVEAWTSQEALDTDEALKKEKDKWVTLEDRFNEQVARWREWATKYQREDRRAAQPAAFAAPDVRTDDWKPVKIPGTLAVAGLPDAGAVWLRHRVKLDAAQAGKDLRLWLTELRLGQVYWDGTQVDDVNPEVLRFVPLWEPSKPWSFVIPGKQVKEGEATLAIRLFSPAGDARLAIDEKSCPLLAGEWLGKAEYELPALDAAAKAAYPGMPLVKGFHEKLMPSFLFSGMIQPLVPYGIKGVVWYQGEANAHDPATYPQKFALMITDWRKRWGSELPFYFCQMPAMGAPKTTAMKESVSARFREAQATALALPNTGQAILFDTADADLHPLNKKDPGERLARVALANTYGRKMAYSGPLFDSMRVEGKQVYLTFRFTDGGLVAKPLPAEYVLRYSSASPDVPVTAPLELPSPGSELQGFAGRGDDGVWKWAQARIERAGGAESVVVWSDDVPKPVAVRYAWADNPTGNLYNGEGLPAPPFRTDGPAAGVAGTKGQ